MTITDTHRSGLEKIRVHLDKIVALLDSLKTGSAMPAVQIMKKLGIQMEEREFCLGFSTAVNTGVISGMVGAKRAGFRKIGPVTASSQFVVPNKTERVAKEEDAPAEEELNEKEEEDFAALSERELGENDDRCILYINSTTRVCPVDSRNWAIQSKSGDTWLSHAWLPDLKSVLKCMSRRLLEKKIRSTSTSVTHAEDVIRVIENAEKNIVETLEKAYTKKA